jgi:hypothetical protein
LHHTTTCPECADPTCWRAAPPPGLLDVPFPPPTSFVFPNEPDLRDSLGPAAAQALPHLRFVTARYLKVMAEAGARRREKKRSNEALKAAEKHYARTARAAAALARSIAIPDNGLLDGNGLLDACLSPPLAPSGSPGLSQVIEALAALEDGARTAGRLIRDELPPPKRPKDEEKWALSYVLAVILHRFGVGLAKAHESKYADIRASVFKAASQPPPDFRIWSSAVDAVLSLGASSWCRYERKLRSYPDFSFRFAPLFQN